jgi:sugar lactone lactonase YvrE
MVSQIGALQAADKYISGKAYVIPKYTATEGEGYFAIIEGHNKCLYIGTHANAVNSWLVEFNTVNKNMRVAVDAHKAIGIDLKGFGSQSKIHTRNNTGASGKIYFGTKQGYPDPAKEKREDYPGGYPMVYDPATDTTKVYPIPVPHHGINSITPDESRGILYVSTCSDGRPGPGENSIFAKVDLKTGKATEIMDTKHIYGFICIDYLGRAYHPTLEGKIVRYNPDTNKTDVLDQTIDGKPPAPESHLADSAPGHPINWDITPDGKTLYSLPLSTNNIYSYDLTAEGDTIKGTSHGELIPGAKQTDCRAMCVGPTGTAWAAITENVDGFGSKLHLVSYKAGDAAPKDHGVVKITNPDFTEFKDKEGKDLPFHGGFAKQEDGTMLTKYVILGVCQAKSGAVYILALHPYSVLEVMPDALK